MSLKDKAVVLLSGGLDSATTLAIAQSRSFECHALTFRYGQRHAVEVRSAEKIAAAICVCRHKIMDLPALGGSALTDQSMAVPKDRPCQSGQVAEIPNTYVPARNTIFLSYALSWAEELGAFDIFIGVTAADYSGYPDCRPQFIEAFETLANVATAAAVQGHGRFRIHAPLINMSKSRIIRTGTALGLDYSLTHSCYDPDENGQPCGRCDSCIIRLKGFREAGLTDPLEYKRAESGI